jgi:hypothetical protein
MTNFEHLTPNKEAQLSIESLINVYKSRRHIFPEYLNLHPLGYYHSRTDSLMKNFDKRY